MKKTPIIFDNIFNDKNIILKNSINYIFYKKLKLLEKKNKFVNFFFYNFFLKTFKKNNLQTYLNFFNNNLNKHIIFNKNNFKKQFFYNINNLKLIYNNNNFKFIFINKLNNVNFFNNSILISGSYLVEKNEDFLENYNLLDFKKIELYKNINSLFYFVNFNIYIFNTLELYKILILIYLYKLNSF